MIVKITFYHISYYDGIKRKKGQHNVVPIDVSKIILPLYFIIKMLNKIAIISYRQAILGHHHDYLQVTSIHQ